MEFPGLPPAFLLGFSPWRMKPRFLGLLIAMNLVWAGTCPIYKVLADQASSGAIATLRYGLATLCLLAAWPWLPGRGPRGRDLLKSLVMGGIVFCLAPRLQIEGVHRGMASDTSLLIALDPLIVAVAAAVFLRERISSRRWWGFGLGMVGVALLSQLGPTGAQSLGGLFANLLFIASFVCEAAYSVMGKPMLARLGTFKLLGAALVGGTLANVSWEGLAGGASTWQAACHLPLSAWGWLVYMALICTITGYALWYWVIRETDVNIAGLTVFIQPVAGLAMSVAWLGEPLHWGQLWGSAIILAGLIVGLRPAGLGQAGWKRLRYFSWRGRMLPLSITPNAPSVTPSPKPTTSRTA